MTTCTQCKGEGRTAQGGVAAGSGSREVCSKCNGTGQLPESQNVNTQVSIPDGPVDPVNPPTENSPKADGADSGEGSGTESSDAPKE